MSETARPVVRHAWWEDIQAVPLGCALIALGISFFAQAGLLSGGTVGLAFLLNYWGDWPLGGMFFLINLPFYALALWRMGWKFTLRTFCAVALVSLFVELTPGWVGLSHIHPLYAALFGGFMIGVGLLMLFRHRASLGGVNILALFLQERFGLRAGHVQMAVDALIVLAAISIVPAERVLLSVVGAVSLNLVLALNHRDGRYMGAS